MVSKIKAATDARREGVLLVARTDARATEGFERALERTALYEEAGADIIFIESPQTMNEIQCLPQVIRAPLLLNMVVGGKTPEISQRHAANLGYSLLLYANAALQGAILGTQNALKLLMNEGSLGENSNLLATFHERQRLVRKPFFDALDRQYAFD